MATDSSKVSFPQGLSGLAQSPLVQLLSMFVPKIGELFGNVTNNNLFRFGASQEAAQQQEETWNEYQAQAEADIQRALEYAGQRPETAMNLFQQQFQPAMDAYTTGMNRAGLTLGKLPGQISEFSNQFLGDFGQMSGDILQGYGDRYRYAEEQLQGYGESARRDINRTYDEELGNIQQSLVDRGLLSSTQAATEQLGSTERRADSLARLQDMLASNRINTLSALSGEQLGAQTQLGLAQSAFESALKGDEFAAQQNLANYQQAYAGGLSGLYGTQAAGLTDLYTGLSGDVLNTMTGINRVPPPQDNTAFGIGMGSAQAPSAPDDYSGWVSGGLGAAGLVLGALLAPYTGGASLSLGPLQFTSSRSVKDVYGPAAAVLDRIERTPVYRWRYKPDLDRTGTEHIGPMAEDFCANFDLGNGREIDTISMLGILFKAVQELREELARLAERTTNGSHTVLQT